MINDPLRIRIPISIKIIPEITCVYFNMFVCFLNSSNNFEAKNATRMNGKINPKQYARIRRTLITPVWLDAYKKTLAKIGPIHGVQEKLKVNPIKKARIGVVLFPFLFTLFFIENSCFKNPILKTPSCNNPIKIIKTPLTICKVLIFSFKKILIKLVAKARMKKVEQIPSTNDSVFVIVLRLLKTSSPCSFISFFPARIPI